MIVNPKRVAKGLWWDRALNLVLGCTPMSEACYNCWSARESAMRANHPHPRIRKNHAGLTANGRFNGTIRYNYNPLADFLRTRKPQVWAVWNDLFHMEVSPDFINHCLATFEKRLDHTVIVLTKRIGRAGRCIKAGSIRPLPDNVIMSTTVELKDHIGRIEALLGIPAKTRMVSLEPLLDGLDLSPYLDPYWDCDSHTKNAILHGLLNEHQADSLRRPVLDWIIIGGENAPLSKARPIGFAVLRYILGQCAETGVACFVKQTGTALAKNQGYQDPKGRDMSEWPEWLRVRQFPERRIEG